MKAKKTPQPKTSKVSGQQKPGQHKQKGELADKDLDQVSGGRMPLVPKDLG